VCDECVTDRNASATATADARRLFEEHEQVPLPPTVTFYYEL